jgi:hypothetical protein
MNIELDKKDFVKIMNSIKDAIEKENKFNKLMDEAGFRYSFENIVSESLYDLITSIVSFLNNTMKLSSDTIDWFIYELDFGKDGEKYYTSFTGSDKKYYLKSVDDLWDFLINVEKKKMQ